ncbi:biotin/lipoyl-binding protein [Herbiconiux moechotypicola]|uniref:HlyD family efflux transporter periplasmic adaptor subunit n=1 Tax=Herbiconiux moechotypicola TaxID=637393 RepID=A0ABP5QJH7_9MICO|nr:biotin/lipoyl-binding protein [Herbiconiux moechotypicola]MCS5730031.1 biotin/lipoyl-binding protein [Herbiconiux moechotypicola]
MKLASRLRRIRTRTWIIAGVAAVVVVGGGSTWAVLAATASSAQASAPTVSTSVAAALETLEKTIDTSGTLAPTVQENVDFAVSGTVTGVNVVAGTTVAAGDVLATVDTLTVNAEALSAQATLAKAQATLAAAEEDDDGSDESAAQIAADEAAVAVAQADADEATAAIADATLVAPVAGLVTAVNLEVGDVVSGSSSSGSGSSGATGSTGGSTSSTTTSTSQFTIVSTDSWQVSLSVGETDVANVAVGDQVELSTDDGTAFFGTVSEVGLLPSTTSGAATYPVTVAVTGSPEGLYDGISVTASIVYERRTDVLTVPSAAVTTDADGASTVTVVADDGTETVTTVTVGETSGTLVEITEGLAEGDLVKVETFTPGSGNSGTDGSTEQGGTGQFPGGGELPEGFDPSQMGGGQGGFPGGTGGTTGGN